jgi:hypothetical protein
MNTTFATVIASLLFSIAATSAQAGLVITLTEQEISGTTAIVATYSGSLDLSATSPSGSGRIANHASPSAFVTSSR